MTRICVFFNEESFNRRATRLKSFIFSVFDFHFLRIDTIGPCYGMTHDDEIAVPRPQQLSPYSALCSQSTASSRFAVYMPHMDKQCSTLLHQRYVERRLATKFSVCMGLNALNKLATFTNGLDENFQKWHALWLCFIFTVSR